jgi:hypothetical protein
VELVGKIEENYNELESIVISFVDDMAWVVEGDILEKCLAQLQRCATDAQECVKENTCKFDIGKPDTILFT